MIPCGEIKIRGFHIDVYSHVNNARYLEFMEEARWVVLEEYIGLKTMEAKGIIFVVVNININYRRAVSMGDKLELYLGLYEIRGKSAIFHQEIRMKGKDTLVSDAKVTFVFADANTGKAVRIDDEIKTLLEQLKI